MYLTVDEQAPHALKGLFAQVPAAVEQGGHNMLQMRVTKERNILRKQKGAVASPGAFAW